MIMVNHIDANDMQYTELNRIIRQKPGEYTLSNVNGQRYIGCGLGSEFKINIHGTPGNDLGAFMDGASVNVFGNCQDATGNSMNQGRIIVHGSASDTAGYAMRNGEIFIQGNAGYRVAIHLKQYGADIPKVVVGGKTGSFLGEYMAGGIVLILGLGLAPGEEITGSHCATGMHGGVIYLAQDIPDYKVAFAMNKTPIDAEDEKAIRPLIEQYCQHFGELPHSLPLEKFVKIRPQTSRPYGKMYVGN
jgi:glutamate synthase domain-containing protein 3